MSRGQANPGKMRERTKNARVHIEDWLYLDDLAGKENPMRVAVAKCVKAHKQIKESDNEELDLPWEGNESKDE